jgi:hypothetical protein
MQTNCNLDLWDAPGWIPSAAATIASVDSLGSATITARA